MEEEKDDNCYEEGSGIELKVLANLPLKQGVCEVKKLGEKDGIQSK